MADYKDIVGTAVRNNAGNLSDDQKDQIFYDSTNVDFKYRIANITSAAWASGGNMNTARGIFAGAGVQTAAIVFGGNDSSSNRTGKTEQYNGSSFSEVSDLNTARQQLAGSKISYNSALAFGGEYTSAVYSSLTETWNGSSWTEVADLNQGRYVHGGAGASNTSALAFGGSDGPSSLAQTESWNGSAWTEVNDLNTARYNCGGAGTATSA